MNIIDEKYYYSCFPEGSVNIDSMKENEKNAYFLKYSLYAFFLHKFLINNTSLKSYDVMLRDSKNYEYIPVKLNDQDVYQYLCNELLDYYYVRNNIHLEMLNNIEMHFLDNRIYQSKLEYDDEVEKFIKATFKKVIYERVRGTIETELNFGPSDCSEFYASNKALIIGQRIYEYTTQPLNTYEEQMKFMDKLEMLRKYREELSEILSKELDVSVAVIAYTSQSIKKVESLSNNEILL